MNQPAVLAGPAGIGKTRLAPAFLAALGLETLIDPWTPDTPLPDGALGITNAEHSTAEWNDLLPNNARAYLVSSYDGLIGTLKFLAPICAECRHIGRHTTCMHPINLRWDQVHGDGLIPTSCKSMRDAGSPCGPTGALFAADPVVSKSTLDKDPLTEPLRAWAKQRSEFTIYEAAAGALGLSKEWQIRSAQTRIGMVLRALGYKRYERRDVSAESPRFFYALDGGLTSAIFHGTAPTIPIPTLADGETYLGAIISADGTYSHHTILLPGDHDDANWQDAMSWAASLGGDLPNRIEQALLFATLKAQFKADWYWSNTLHASGASYAWYQTFSNGYQHYGRIDFQCRARAVRRLPIQPFSNLA